MPGKLVGGVWLPDTEVHFVDNMTQNERIVDGKLTYQYKKWEAAQKYIKNWRVAVDIGAHVGLWSMHLVKHFDKVEAFEPVPLHRELFEKNVEGVYSLHGVALGEECGVVDIQVPDETTGNAHVAVEGRHPGTRHVPNPDKIHTIKDVKILPLDDYEFDSVDFIKIDVEGLERAVISGASRTIQKCKPVMVVEQKGNDSAYGDEPQAAIKLLESWGYRTAQNYSGDYIMVCDA